MTGILSIATRTTPMPFSAPGGKLYRVACIGQPDMGVFHMVIRAADHNDAKAKVRARGYRPVAVVDL